MDEVLDGLIDKLSYTKGSPHLYRIRYPPHQKESYYSTYDSVAYSFGNMSLYQWHFWGKAK
jgi:hypothetical protein